MVRKICTAMLAVVILYGCKTDDSGSAEEACPRNVEVGLLAISATSATIKWVETQGFGSNYEYGEKGFELGSGIKGNTNDENVVISDLNPDTEYDFYLQSMCTAEIQGEFTTNPYTFRTLTCFELVADNISIVGYLADGEFGIDWYPKRNAENWQAAMMEKGTNTPSEDDIYLVEDGTHSSRFLFPDIDPDKDYTFFVRGRCNGTYGDWVLKDVDPGFAGLHSPCLVRVQNLNVYREGISFNVLTSGTVQVEILEKGTTVGSGLLVYTTHINLLELINAYPDYLKANTEYDVLARLKCGPSYSEDVWISSFRTPIANSANFTFNEIQGEELLLFWPSYQYSDCKIYSQVIFEIEYGPQGFLEGEGISIITDGMQSEYNGVLEYALPLSSLESGTTYEFSIRSIVNNDSFGEWNTFCNYGEEGRLVFTAP